VDLGIKLIKGTGPFGCRGNPIDCLLEHLQLHVTADTGPTSGTIIAYFFHVLL
jgi:hypothetical protein